MGAGWSGTHRTASVFRVTAVMVAVSMIVAGFMASPVRAATGGTVVGWGYDYYGQASPPADLTDVIAVAVGNNHSLALKSNGTVVAWGWNDFGQGAVPAGLSDVVAISAPSGGAHNLALKSDGTVVAWGHSAYGQINVPVGLTDVVAISAGNHHSLALKSNGTVVAWGSNTYGQLNVPAGLDDATAIAALPYGGLALKSNGTVVAWGQGGGSGQLVIPVGLSDVVAIDGGEAHSLALKSNGTVVAWGNNQFGQTNVPAGLDDAIAIAAGPYDSLALKSDGTVVAWGRNDAGQGAVPSGLSDVVAIAIGYSHSLAVVGQNEPPVADAGGPYLGAMGEAITFDATASSDPDGDPLSYDWTWGDTAASLDAGPTPTHAYGAAGIYDVCLTVNDGAVDSAQVCTPAVVYDPSAGFVTGGGWFNSPEGAYVPDGSLSGKATFGFVAKYKKGASVPDGNTEFQFKAGDLNFHSSAYDWLVVTGSDYARFKGTGTINGAGEYQFMIWAGDGSPDTFRIKIWTEDELGVETIVYDNGADQPLGGGSIIVHTK